MAAKVATDHAIKYEPTARALAVFVVHSQKKVRFAVPKLLTLGYPHREKTRVWIINWRLLPMELPFLAPDVEFQVRTTAVNIRRLIETRGGVETQARIVLRRLATTRGLAVPLAIATYTVHQLIQWARLNDLGTIFSAEVDRIRARIALKLSENREAVGEAASPMVEAPANAQNK
jgi:hypothetical protein